MAQTTVIVHHNNQQHQQHLPVDTTVSEVLSTALKHFQLDSQQYQLALTNNQSIDHSQSLQSLLQSVTAPLMFTLSPQSNQDRSNHCLITLHLNDEQSTVLSEQFTINQSISDILAIFQAQKPEFPMLSYFGIPPVEKKTGFSLYVNIPGNVQSVVSIMEVDTTGTQSDQSSSQSSTAKHPIKQLSSDEAFMETTIALLGYQSQTPNASRITIKLSHQYTAPKMTEQQQQSIIDNFQSKFDRAMSEVVDARTHNEELRKQQEAERLEEDRLLRLNEAKVNLPADRNRRIFIAPVGLAEIPDLPDEFYEPTEQEKEEYAQSIIAQAEKERAELEAARNPAKAAKEAKRKAKQQNSQITKPKRKLNPAVNLIRVKLPSHMYIEGLFKSHETIGSIRKFLRSTLSESAHAFHLFITPPKQRLDNDSTTLAQLRLFGSVLILLSFDEPLAETSNTDSADPHRASAARLLTPELVDSVQVLSPVRSTEHSASEMDEKHAPEEIKTP